MFGTGILAWTYTNLGLLKNGASPWDIEKEHPRLFLTDSQMSAVQNAIAAGGAALTVWEVIKSKSDDYLTLPPLQRVINGRRMLSVSQEALKRIFYLSAAYRISGEDKYAARAINELKSVCRFRDWHPSHFLDTAEMTTAVAIGYDLLFERLSPFQRLAIRKAIIRKGLLPSLLQGFWNNLSNWNSVCCAGIAIGAAAVYETWSRYFCGLIRRAISSNSRCVGFLFGGGDCAEGLHYWSYACSFEAMMFSSLENSFGKELLDSENFKAILNSAETAMMLDTPSGGCFNYYDAPSECGISVAQVWLAAKSGKEKLIYPELRKLRKDKLLADREENRLLPAVLAFGSKLDWASVPTPDSGSYSCSGKTPLYIYRSGWTSGEDTYLAVKGGCASDSHAHMDGGSFIFKSEGVLWAKDIGKENYYSLEAAGLVIHCTNEGSDRWKVFAHSDQSHNILTIKGLAPSVKARIGFIRANLPETVVAGCALENTDLYLPYLSESRREISLEEGLTLNIIDSFTVGEKSISLRWAICTDTEVKIIDNDKILLSANGKSRYLEVESTLSHNSFITKPILKAYETPLNGAHMIGFEFEDIPAFTEGCLRVRLIACS